MEDKANLNDNWKASIRCKRAEKEEEEGFPSDTQH